MKAYHYFTIAMLMFLIVSTIGCSESGVTPGDPPNDNPVISPEQESGLARTLWGVWDISFDPVTMEAVALPVRDVTAHFDVTTAVTPPACDDCVAIEVNSFDPVTRILDADVTLRNPYPISGRDVRGILFTNDPGHEMQNPDDWTKLWDIPGGGTLNPFRTFAKGAALRHFSGLAHHTENYLIYIPVPPQYAAIRFAVDASWPGNCKEPYMINGFDQEDEIYNIGGSSGMVEVKVYDWQEDVSGVSLVLPEVTGDNFSAFTHIGSIIWRLEIVNDSAVAAGDYEGRIIASSPNALDQALYDFVTVTITEAIMPVVSGIDPSNAQAGDDLVGVTITGSGFQGDTGEVVLLQALEPQIDATNVVIVDESTVTCDISIPPLAALGMYDVRVTDEPGLSGTGDDLFDINEPTPDNPVDVTPEWLNFAPDNITVVGDYAYVAAGVNGMHIFWVFDPSSPIWIDKIDAEDRIYDVALDGNFAYAADGYDGVQIFDITIPGLPNLVNTVAVNTNAERIDAVDGYAYVCDGYDLAIIDVDPPGSAYIVTSVDMGNSCDDVVYQNGYAYAAVAGSSVIIVDVEPPGDASIVHTVPTPGETYTIDAENGYAYICEDNDGFSIIDIDPPGSASVIKTVPTNASCSVAVSGEYAYVSDSDNGLLIIDINPPGDAAVITTLDCNPTHEAPMLDYSDGYVYLANNDTGIFVIDVDPPESPTMVGSKETMGSAQDVYFDNGLAYVANGSGGMAIVDVHPIEASYFVSSVRSGAGQKVHMTGGYAYLSDWDAGLVVVDVDPVETPVIIHTVDTGDGAIGLDVKGSWAYTTSFNSQFDIIDIETPGAASVYKNVPMAGQGFDVVVGFGIAYAADSGNIRIIDIDPQADASIINTVATTTRGKGLYLLGEYLYVAEGHTSGYLDVIDIEPPGSASVIKTVPLLDNSYAVAVSGGYAYIANFQEGLTVVDIDPIGSASIIGTLDTPGLASGVFVTSYIAYVADRRGGLRIIELW